MAGTIIRKSTACQTHGDDHDVKMIKRQKHSNRGPVKFQSAKKGTKRSRKY